MMKIILVIIYLILTISGLILMKKGGNSGTLAIENGNASFVINLISFAGLFCYLFSFLLFTKIVIMFDLSYIMPICTGIVQVMSLIASKIIFKENISIYGIIGASLVIAGIIVMNLKR